MMDQVNFTPLQLGSAFASAGIMPHNWESAMMRNQKCGGLFDPRLALSKMSRLPGEINVIDMLIGFWFDALSEDEQIEVGMMVTGDMGLPDNVNELVDVSDLLEIPHNHKTGAVAMCILFGTSRLCEVMQTVHVNPERLALDKREVITDVVESLMSPLPF